MIKADQPTIFPSNIIAVVSSIKDGSVKYGVDESDEQVAHNLSSLANNSKLNVQQVAGIRINYDEEQTYDVIKEVNSSHKLDLTDKSTWIDCDALVTTQKRLGMLIPIADCNGVIVYDPVNQVLALAHIGWHAAEANLASKLIQYLTKVHNSDPAELLVYISPSIRQDSYFNDNPTQLNNPVWKKYIKKSDKGFHMDIFGFTHDQMIESGVLKANIEASTVDVAQSDYYYSHFQSKLADKQSGRYAVLCAIK